MGLLLIREEIEDVQYLTEGEGSSKKFYIQGPMLAGGVKNRNGRIYPMHVLEPEAVRYIAEVIEAGSGWGELSHPQSPSINPDRVSHRTVSLTRDGNNYIGKAVIVEGVCGAQVRGMLNSGGKVGVSSRAMGSLKENSQGIMEVQNDLRIATCADIVLDPSGPGCWVNGIMEGVEFTVNDQGAWIQHETRKELRKLSLRELQEQRVQRMAAFFESLVNPN